MPSSCDYVVTSGWVTNFDSEWFDATGPDECQTKAGIFL